MLHIKNLSYRYTRALPWDLQNIDLSLAEQGILGLLGHNGAGKRFDGTPANRIEANRKHSAMIV
jgi:ABC-type uncharacterized transport system ATPase subunit